MLDGFVEGMLMRQAPAVSVTEVLGYYNASTQLELTPGYRKSGKPRTYMVVIAVQSLCISS